MGFQRRTARFTRSLRFILQAEGYSGIGDRPAVDARRARRDRGLLLLCPALFRRYSLSTLLLASFVAPSRSLSAIGWRAGLLLAPAGRAAAARRDVRSLHAASVAAVRRVFPKRAQGRGQTLFSSLSYGAGGAAGALLAGWTWAAAGRRLAFDVIAASLGACFFLSLRRFETLAAVLMHNSHLRSETAMAQTLYDKLWGQPRRARRGRRHGAALHRPPPGA